MNSLDIQQQLADQRRGRYVRVSDVDRRLLIDTYKKGEDFIALAKKLNIEIVAEIIDNEDDLNFIKKLGIDYYQGYYFAQPSLNFDDMNNITYGLNSKDLTKKII